LTPEADAHLDKARHCLANGYAMLAIGLGDEAGRAAYLAAFHAAQAFLFERRGKTPKTHAGVHGQFGRLARNEPSIPIDLRRFLAQAYDMKTYADYETRRETVLPARAATAIDTASRFIDCVAALIGEAP
jgi:uncharacterized protein (UPF0332 family)